MVDRAWEIRSENDLVGGYSALMLVGEAGLVAASDAGRLLFLRREGSMISDPVPEKFVNSLDRDKLSVDIESLTRDPATGKFWAGYENTNAIQRFSSNFRLESQIFPKAMEGWKDNSGPEAMVRLPDGHFIVLAEARDQIDGKAGHEALLFAEDPTRSVSPPKRFVFDGLDGYRPVDMANLADGRVLILMRTWSLGLPPQFTGAIMVADPRVIEKGGRWKARLLARLEAPLPSDNFEGIAVEEGPQDQQYVWIISDNNFMLHQRSLLLRLRWERKKARE